MSHTPWDPVEKIAASVRDGSVSAIDLVKRSLVAVDEHSDYNAVIATLEDYALERAAEIDEQVASGAAEGKLLGVPFVIKDNYMMADQEMTAASNILKGFTSPITSTVLQRLIDEGAIPVARANLDAFAHGSSTENSDFGVTKNAHDPSKVAGGSSGGSAVAVALDMAPFALGSDTGGSIRQPAAFNGIIGYKPSYGLNSRYGVVAMASSTDCMGFFTKSAADLELLTNVTAGVDPNDSTTVEINLQPETVDLTGLKVGRVKQFEIDGLDDEVRASYTAWLDAVAKAGATVVDIDIPVLENGLAVYYIVQPAEVSSNLARYDGMRYGFSDESAQSLEDVYSQSRSIGFNAENQRRLMLGTFVLNSGYQDAYYNKALKVRTLMIEQINAALERVDCLVGPTTPTAAFDIGQNAEDPLAMYLADVLAVGYSLAGQPALSLPIANGADSGLPVGVQIATSHGQDAKLFAITKQLEGID